VASTWWSIVVDCADIHAQSTFWAEVLGYRVVSEAEDEVVIAPDESTKPDLVFGIAPEGKSVKNRLHIDLNPDDQEAEVRRLVGLGARRIDIGQGDVPWTVMADPEGNEFCVLAHHPDQS
jgi:predicted enzyme related to lactoylglutathione lyase